jgi:hypothetical protein
VLSGKIRLSSRVKRWARSTASSTAKGTTGMRSSSKLDTPTKSPADVPGSKAPEPSAITPPPGSHTRVPPDFDFLAKTLYV